MKETIKIHFFYVVVILLAIIIFLVTAEWARIPDLLAHITFALTVSTLFLAILAIAYAFVSNSSLSQYLGRFDTVAQEMSKSATDISNVATALDVKVETIPPLLEDVGEQVGRAELLLREISKKEPSGSTLSDTSVNLDALATTFMEKASLAGDLFLHALVLSVQQSTPFNSSDFESKCSPSTWDYLFGFLSATYSAQLLNYEYKKNILTVTQINQVIVDGIQDTLERKEELLEGKFKEFVRSTREGIEDYFAE